MTLPYPPELCIPNLRNSLPWATSQVPECAWGEGAPPRPLSQRALVAPVELRLDQRSAPLRSLGAVYQPPPKPVGFRKLKYVGESVPGYLGAPAAPLRQGVVLGAQGAAPCGLATGTAAPPSVLGTSSPRPTGLSASPPVGVAAPRGGGRGSAAPGLVTSLALGGGKAVARAKCEPWVVHPAAASAQGLRARAVLHTGAPSPGSPGPRQEDVPTFCLFLVG